MQETIDSTGDYPKFSKFVGFVVKEARIACNTVSSFYALKDTETKSPRDHKNSNRKVNVFATTSIHQTIQRELTQGLTRVINARWNIIPCSGVRN